MPGILFPPRTFSRQIHSFQQTFSRDTRRIHLATFPHCKWYQVFFFPPNVFAPHTLFFWQTAYISHYLHYLPNIRCARLFVFFWHTFSRHSRPTSPLSLSLSSLSLSPSLVLSLPLFLPVYLFVSLSELPRPRATSKKPVQLLDFLESATPPLPLPGGDTPPRRGVRGGGVCIEASTRLPIFLGYLPGFGRKHTTVRLTCYCLPPPPRLPGG